MEKITGQSAVQGIAIGCIAVYSSRPAVADAHEIINTEAEIKKYHSAKDETAAELDQLELNAEKRAGMQEAGIFAAYKQILLDPAFEEKIKSRIAVQHCNAEYAVAETGKELAEVFMSMKDSGYMQQRSADMKAIADMVIKNLCCSDDKMQDFNGPVILMAEDLTPAETMKLDTSKILAFVTSGGSVNSHTAILAGSLGITAVVNTGRKPETWMNGKPAIVDGPGGAVFIDPDSEQLSHYAAVKKKYEEDQLLLNSVSAVPAVTGSGQCIRLCANAAGVQDVKKAAEAGADGIGLFRSEFLFLGRGDFPSEEEQFASYRQAAQLMDGKEVIIRTIDIGADKKADYFGLEPEANPAMGMRAIRICLKRPELFKTQLRAIYRASAFGRIALMFPMITSVCETDKIISITDEVLRELDSNGVPHGQVKRGIMVETPAAAVISDLLAEKVDFFSIGTNDLTQYTLAMDRQNAELGCFADTHHPAVLRMIEMTVRNAHKNGIPVGICGELAADRTLTEFFIKTGIDELSVSVPKLPELRRHITELMR